MSTLLRPIFPFSSPPEGEESSARTCDSKCALALQGEGNVLAANANILT